MYTFGVPLGTPKENFRTPVVILGPQYQRPSCHWTGRTMRDLIRPGSPLPVATCLVTPEAIPTDHGRKTGTEGKEWSQMTTPLTCEALRCLKSLCSLFYSSPCAAFWCATRLSPTCAVFALWKVDRNRKYSSLFLATLFFIGKHFTFFASLHSMTSLRN